MAILKTLDQGQLLPEVSMYVGWEDKGEVRKQGKSDLRLEFDSDRIAI